MLRDVDLTIAAGERIALLGESGSGKSTLLNLIAGLETADSGQIYVGDTAVHALNADQAAIFRRRSIGFAFQAFHLLPHLSAQRNVAVPLLLNGIAAAQALEQAREALGRVGLADRAGALPGELSGGEQQRVALMRALIHRPLLVLADEPTGNLDPKSAAGALREIEEQVGRSGAALLIATHSEQAAAIAGRRLLLVDYRLRELPR